MNESEEFCILVTKTGEISIIKFETVEGIESGKDCPFKNKKSIARCSLEEFMSDKRYDIYIYDVDEYTNKFLGMTKKEAEQIFRVLTYFQTI